MRFRYVVLFLIFVSIGSKAQDAQPDVDNTACQEVLNQADVEFNAGHFYGIPSLLKDCLDKLTNEQKVHAYLLLAQSYLLIDDPIGAEDSYLKLLKADPEYVADEIKDAIDVFYLSKKFTSTPIFTPHGGLGGSMAFTQLLHENDTDPYDKIKKERSGFGWHFGGGMDWNINDNISVTGEVQYAYKVFKTTIEKRNDPRLETITEKQNWIDIPVYLKYRASSGKIRPYAYAGIAINLLLGAKVELASANKFPSLGGNSQTITEGPDVNIAYMRNFLNRSLVFGGGVLYKIGKDYLYADARYMPGLTNLANEANTFYGENGFDLVNEATKYEWLSSSFRLSNVAISVGYVYPLYYPRKVKKARTNSAFRKISKQGDEEN